MNKTLFSALLTLGTLAAPAQAATVFSTNFESGLPAQVTGLGTVQSVQGLPAGNFGQQHLYNDTTLTGNAGATILTLAGLAAHSSLSLTFDFVAWNSWDGVTQAFPQGDLFEVLLDGNVLLTISTNNASGTASIPAQASLIAGPSPFGYGDSSPFFNSDTAYAVTLNNIAHANANAVFSFRVNGVGWQGGTDEAFGLDNILVSSNAQNGAVPEPATWALMLAGFGTVGFAMRRRRRHPLATSFV